MAAQRKPKVEFYWSLTKKTKEEKKADRAEQMEKGILCSGAAGSNTKRIVNWRLVGANGEVMCQCTQGFRDKTDARRNFDDCVGLMYYANTEYGARIIGPGRKPV